MRADKREFLNELFGQNLFVSFILESPLGFPPDTFIIIIARLA